MNGSNNDRNSLMQKISECEFMMIDLGLYLDTHPDCMKGMELFSKLQERRHDLLKEYARLFYPLTIDSMSGNAVGGTGEFSWGDCPAPWEGGMCKCGTMRSAYNFR